MTATAVAPRTGAERVVKRAPVGERGAMRPVSSNQAALHELAATITPPARAVGTDADELGVRHRGETITVQRRAGDDDIGEQLIRAYLNDEAALQRKAEGRPNPDDNAEGEQILMQSKHAGTHHGPPGTVFESRVRSLESLGEPLSPAVRRSMEPRFGRDFSDVRVHAYAGAAALARAANARAFTVGRNVVFANGQYAPEDADGRRLLAHELTHVIQQRRGGPALQRKILVAGKPFTPSPMYYAFVALFFGAAMTRFVAKMHGGGTSPDFSFDSFEQLGTEIRVRAFAIKGIEVINDTCCFYPSSAAPAYVDSAYWEKGPGTYEFRLKAPLPAGKKPSDAVEAIFSPNAETRLECRGMTQAVEYYAMVKALGAAAFNAKFPGGISIGTKQSGLTAGPYRPFQRMAVASKSDILPGDWVYFKNFRDYPTRVGGYWRGENAIYLGDGQFGGFGVPPQSELDLDKTLVERYNLDAEPHLNKTVGDLIADGGGLLLEPVVRPIASRLSP